MGNDNSKNPKYGGANIFIEIKNPTQVAGQKVQGTIHLNCAQHWQDGDQLWVQIEGEEKSKWVDIEHRTIHEGENVRHETIRHKREGK
jgi:hypothetical protein